MTSSPHSNASSTTTLPQNKPHPKLYRATTSVRESFTLYPYPVYYIYILYLSPLYSLNSLNSLPLAWDTKDNHGLSDRDRTPDTTSQRAKSLLSSESPARMPFGPCRPFRPLPYTPLYSLNSLNSLPLAWDTMDNHRHPNRDRTPDTTPRCKVTAIIRVAGEQSHRRECLSGLLALLGLCPIKP